MCFPYVAPLYSMCDTAIAPSLTPRSEMRCPETARAHIAQADHQHLQETGGAMDDAHSVLCPGEQVSLGLCLVPPCVLNMCLVHPLSRNEVLVAVAGCGRLTRCESFRRTMTVSRHCGISVTMSTLWPGSAPTRVLKVDGTTLSPLLH